MVAAVVSAVFGSDAPRWKRLPSNCHTTGADRHGHGFAGIFDREGNLWHSRRADRLNRDGDLSVLRHARHGIARDGHDHVFGSSVRLGLAMRISSGWRMRIAR